MASPIDWKALFNAANAAKENAYAPYSKFRVGAAVLAPNGNMYSGCNVENASFGATICAERIAIGNAIASGAEGVIAIALTTDADTATPPCGMCRQVIVEFGGAVIVRSYVNEDDFEEYTSSDLMPHAFSADSFQEK